MSVPYPPDLMNVSLSLVGAKLKQFWECPKQHKNVFLSIPFSPIGIGETLLDGKATASKGMERRE
jgi:hypothetical protein